MPNSKEYNKAYYDANPQAQIKRSMDWASRHHDKVLAAQRRYRKKPDKRKKYNEYQRNYRKNRALLKELVQAEEGLKLLFGGEESL